MIDVEAKRSLRWRMRKLRLVADQKEGPVGTLAITRFAMENTERLGLEAGKVVAGYWPIVTEIDPRPLMARLEERGLTCALPVIVSDDQPLIFRAWSPRDGAVQAGPRGTFEPEPSAEQVEPDVILAPVLGFDRAGRRLGQGGGYYDRTLAALRARKPVNVIGVAYGLQEIDAVPEEETDARIDWFLTERELTQVRT
jgi:5-formyltetrahydrofolate cyclo-ligase